MTTVEPGFVAMKYTTTKLLRLPDSPMTVWLVKDDEGEVVGLIEKERDSRSTLNPFKAFHMLLTEHELFKQPASACPCTKVLVAVHYPLDKVIKLYKGAVPADYFHENQTPVRIGGLAAAVASISAWRPSVMA